MLSAVQLNSVGFWEFLGSLNPLEVIRKHLSDRHERRKDKEYRESADERRMALENLALENKIIAERIRIAKDIGALAALDRYQDKRVIDGADGKNMT